MESSSGPSSPASGHRLPPNSRHSLEIFNPSAASLRPTTPTPTWQNWNAPRVIPGQTSSEEIMITSWMAFQEPENLNSDAAAQRAAEWGLVLKTDTDTGKLKGVTARTSGGDETYNNRTSGTTPRRNSNTSVRSSGELSDGGGRDKGLPRVSQDLKDALSAFQQTFVVSDATKPDHPILYASAGFFKMTGYTSKEVIGTNCRFLQGPETKAEDVAKIREALKEGRSYCGRLLNYKKDGTAFWNLLTISPIKDENGVVLKFIGMQVDTEGYTDNSIRPNGLPESLIRYDGRQKDLARNSVSELVDAVQKPNILIESTNHPPKSEKPEKGKALAGENLEELVNIPPNLNNPRPRKRSSHGSSRRNSMHCITEVSDKSPTHKNEPNDKKQRKSSRFSLTRLIKRNNKNSKDKVETKVVDDNGGVEDDNDNGESSEEETVKMKETRKGMDLATTLERIEKNFVITDPRLPDNPIIFASDSFLELTEYNREEILGRNCRFLQGPETDPATVRKIREAIDNQTDVTVQLINYTKSGKKFWNLFHLQAMRDQKGEVQYFIGVQLDGSENVEPLHNCIPEETAKEDEKLVKATAENVDEAARELPDANLTPEDLWMNHSKTVHAKPHRKNSPSWRAIQKILDSGEQVGLKHFKSIKPLGIGDTGSVHLVELCGSGLLFAMKAMDKSVMLNRNKVHRVCAEREILDKLDHPFLPALYASFQTKTHICLIIDYCPGGELFLLLDRQPKKVLREDAVRFYAAEVVVALEYLHYHGIIYRDLKPENILLQSNGHVSLTDFDLSCLTSCKPQILIPTTTDSKKQHKGQQKHQQTPIFMAEPMRASNSFVGTEEYIAPEIVTGAGHTSAVDWWALGALLYEMFYGYTPFRGKTRQKTFANIIHKDLRFPRNKLASVSLHAKELMYQLLQKDPKDRLGSRQGANEIKSHPFFQGINWALVRCTNPPELDVPLPNEEKELELAPLELHNNVF